MAENERLDNALRELFAEDHAPSKRPSRGELQDLVDGRLDPESKDALLGRVALDPEATDELLELRRLAAGANADPARVDAVMSALNSPALAFPERRPAPPSSLRRGFAVAASLVLSSILVLLSAALWRDNAAMRGELQNLRQHVTTLESPRAGVPILDLFSTPRLRGDGDVGNDGRPVDDIPFLDLGDAGLATLILTPNDPVPGRDYRLDITGADARTWSFDLEAEESGAVVLVLGTPALSAGRTRFELHSGDGPDADVFWLDVGAGP